LTQGIITSRDLGQASNEFCSRLRQAGADKEKNDDTNNACKSKIRKFSYGGLLLAALSLMGVTLTLSADDRKVETIDATAMGTSTQLGKW